MTIQMASHGLTNMYNEKLSKLQNKHNANTIAQYINTLRHENASFSDHYRTSIIKVLNRLSNFCEKVGDKVTIEIKKADSSGI
jgi:hypothetical protein